MDAFSDGSDADLVVALSGGIDSCVLLTLCHDYAPARTRAVHVNHGYAPESASWQQHCQSLCDGLGVPLQAVTLQPQPGQALREGVAREARYRVFSEQIGEREVLLLAHHRDDHAESVLLHLLQGRGVFGMPQCRPFGNGWLLRPMLGASRDEIVRFARSRAIVWLDDPSNQDTQHDRNYLRHEIVPLLSGRFAPLAARLNQAAGHVADVETMLIEQLGLAAPELKLELLAGFSASQQMALIRLWLSRNDLGQPSSRALSELLTQLSMPEDRQPALQIPGGRLYRYRRQLCFAPKVNVDTQPREISGRTEVSVSQGRLLVSHETPGLKPVGAPWLRFWQASDQADLPRTLLVRGHRRRIRELLRQASVPPWRREGYPVICDDRGVLCLPEIADRDGARATAEGLQFRWLPAHR